MFKPTEALTIPETCEETRIGRTKIYEEINAGRLVARKFGKKTLILRSDLRDFLNALPSSRAPPAAPAPSAKEPAHEPVHPLMGHNNPPEPMEREKQSGKRTARGSAGGRQARTRSTPPGPRSLAMSNAVLEDTPRR